MSVALTTNRNVDTALVVFSYDACVMTGINPTNLPSAGSVFTVNGMNFGNKDEMGKRNVRIGDTACHSPEWTSDSSMTCMSMVGMGHRLNAAVTVAGDQNRFSEAVSYDQAVMRTLSLNEQYLVANSPASGNVMLLVSGQSFGAYEMTPLSRAGDTLCSYTEWIDDETIRCLMPRASTTTRFYPGESIDVRLTLQNLVSVNHDALTYDQACAGPCVGSLLCDERHGSSRGLGRGVAGCSGPTGGDARHTLNAKRVQFDEFSEESIVRIHGNFSLGATHVLVGNTTDNVTVPVREKIYQGDVKITFGGLYACEIIMPDDGDDTTLEQYIDCVLPPGVGADHKIEVVIRNSSYAALLQGCTETMKEFGENTYLGQPFGNCLQPTPGTDYVRAVDAGLAYSYSRPEITSITPSHGVNMANTSFDITIYGANMGGSAREVYRSKCLEPAFSNLRACQLLMTNGVVIFNRTCQDVDLLASSAGTPLAIEQQIEAQKVALCRDRGGEITFKCQHAFQQAKEYASPYSSCVVSN